MLGVGLDWAEEVQVVALGRPERGVVELMRVEHSPAGMDSLIARIAALEPDPAGVRVVLETRHGRLVDALVDAGVHRRAGESRSGRPPPRPGAEEGRR